MTLKPGDKITTIEQLENLPINTILKTQRKTSGLRSVGIIKPWGIESENRTYFEDLTTQWFNNEYEKLLCKHIITVVEIPEREWKTGDKVEAWEQARELPEGTVLVSTKSLCEVWVKLPGERNIWKTTYTGIWSDENDPIPTGCFPLQILRLGKE